MPPPLYVPTGSMRGARRSLDVERSARAVALDSGWAVSTSADDQQSRWDPAPFILLNLMVSFQAAYTGPQPVLLCPDLNWRVINASTFASAFSLTVAARSDLSLPAVTRA